MANVKRYQDMQVSSASIAGDTVTADKNTDAVNPGDCDRIGFSIKISSSGGTGFQLDIYPQFSPDGGTTWVGLPGAANSSTDATAQLTADGDISEWYENSIPFGDDDNLKLRFNLDISGTSGTYDVDYAKWWAK